MAQCISFFSNCSSLGYGCYLYTDEKRTTTVGAGWISDGTNVYSVNSSGMITAVNACSNCQPPGTFITSYCGGWSGYDLYYTYADGSCGTYDSLVEYNSSTCGYSPQYGCNCYGYCDTYPHPCYYYGCEECIG
jgi:hypothetical protein